MKTINNYTIYCTPEQTKKALELGAPLFRLYSTGSSEYIDMLIISDTEAYVIPAAEQLIGWLEEQELIESIEINKQMITWTGYVWLTIDRIKIQSFSTRQEATLAAIDVALDYLEDKKTSTR